MRTTSFSVYMIVFLVTITGLSCSTNVDEGRDGFSLSKDELAELFTPVPQDAPFKLTLDLEKKTEDEENVITMHVTLHNPTDDTLHIAMGAPSGLEPYYNFAVTTPDSTYIWSRLQLDIRYLAMKTLSLAPGGKKSYTHTWDYTTPDGKPVEQGEYLIFGSIEGIRTYPTSAFKTTDKKYGNIGVLQIANLHP